MVSLNKSVYYDRSRIVYSYSPNSPPVINQFDMSYSTFNTVVVTKPDVVRVPDWRNLIRKRRPASAGWSRQGLNVRLTKGSARHAWQDINTKASQDTQVLGQIITFDVIPSLWSPSITALDARVQTDLLRKIYQAQTTFQGGIFLGEFKEVVHMFRHPLSAITSQLNNYLKAVTKGKRSGMSVAKMNRMVAGTWLEYAYGFSPLISDLKNAAEAYSHLIARVDSETLHSFGEIDGFRIGSPYVVGVGSYVNIFYKELTIDKLAIKYSAGIRHNAESTLQTIGDFGIGLRDFVPTVWELIPYSFLADYVVNVGDCLEAMSARVADVFFCTRTIKSTSTMSPSDIRIVNNLDIPGTTNPITTAIGFNPNKIQLQTYSFNRNVVDPFSLTPSLRWKIGGSLQSWRKITNVSALLAQSQSASRFLTQGKSK